MIAIPWGTKAQPLRVENLVTVDTSRGEESRSSLCCMSSAARCPATHWHGNCKLLAVFLAGSSSPPAWVGPAQPEEDPSSQAVCHNCPRKVPLEQLSPSRCRSDQRVGLSKNVLKQPPDLSSGKSPALCLPQPPLKKMRGESFASSSPVHVGPQLQALLRLSVRSKCY